MHRFNGFATLGAAANVGLVGDDNQKEVRSLELRTPVGNVLVKLQLLDVKWRMGRSVADRDPVDYSVAIEKNCASRYFVPSRVGVRSPNSHSHFFRGYRRLPTILESRLFR